VAGSAGRVRLLADVYKRHRRWSLDGTWEKVLEELRAGCDEAEGADWTLSADASVTRAHQHAAGARLIWAQDDRVGGAVE
jgi:transposase